MAANKAFGQLMKRLREDKGINQAELAELIGVSPPYISQIELGKRIPIDELCIKLGQALDYDAQDLVDQARRARAPKTEDALITLRYASNPNDKGGRHVDDPRLKNLGARLHSLEDSLPEDQYKKIWETIYNIVEAYTDAYMGKLDKQK